jgi:hypothetical protein
MKNIQLSIITLISMGFLGYSGGDIAVVTPYESDDIQNATDAAVPYIEPIEEEVVVVPNPTPTPIVQIPTPQPKPQPKKSIYSNGFYVGLGITGTRYNGSCKCTTSTSSIPTKVTNRETNIALLGRVGYDFNQYIGIEVRGMKSIAREKDFSLSHIGLFLKPMIPIGNITNFYTLIGVAKTKTNGNIPKVDAESIAYGGGFEIDLSKDVPKNGRYSREFNGKGDQESGIGLFIDYERLVAKKSSPDLDSISAGVTYDF